LRTLQRRREKYGITAIVGAPLPFYYGAVVILNEVLVFFRDEEKDLVVLGLVN
jgi:hypothetical protein